MKCPLCKTSQNERRVLSPRFYNCLFCGSVFRNPEDYLSLEEEQERYLNHQNDVDDAGYQSFVSPLVTAVQTSVATPSIGLDYGAGTGPVATKLLREKGYVMELWDPFFHNNPKALKRKYDFIICCEVIEHFYKPFEEFNRLKGLLNADGILFCKTELLPTTTSFEDWYYKNDKTHVIFYCEQNLSWIKENIGFTRSCIQEDFISYTK